MCEFCLKHGEGKKWCLQANNYSDKLLSGIRASSGLESSFVMSPWFRDDDNAVASLRDFHLNYPCLPGSAE